MKKLSYLMLTPLLIAALAGCGSKNKKDKPLTDQEIVEETAKNPSLILTSGGAIVYSGTTTQMKSGDFFIGMNSFQYSETQKVEITWSFDKSDKWTTGEYKKDPTYVTLTPSTVYESADEYKSTITATAKLNDATATTTFYAYMNHTKVSVKSIKGYREGYDKGEISGADYIRFFGYVTGKMTDTYAGVYVGSGSYGIMLYAGNLEAQWNANGLKVGDLVDVMGSASPYNGLFEVKPQWVRKATATDLPAGYELENPTSNEIDLQRFNATDLHLKDGAMATMESLRYLGAGAANSKPEIADNKFNPANHAYIWFSNEIIYRAAFIAQDAGVLKAYTGRSGTGTSADPYVYTGEITSPEEGTLFIDAGGGNVYRVEEQKLVKIDMSKRIDFNKGYVNEGKFYKDKEYKNEVSPTYGGVFLDLDTNDFYYNRVDAEGTLLFSQINLDEQFEFEVEVPCYYNYHQGADEDGASIDAMLKEWTVRDTYVDFEGFLSWYNGPNLAPIGGADCFSTLK